MPGNPNTLFGYCSTQGDAAALGGTCAAGGPFCAKAGGRFAGICASVPGQFLCAPTCALGTSCGGGKTCKKPFSNSLFGACL